MVVPKPNNGKKDLIPRRIQFVKAGGKGSSSSGKIDPNGPPEPPYYLYDPDEVPQWLGWKKQNKVGAGLQNTGNSCYLNSVMQALTYSPALNNFLKSDCHAKTCKKKASNQFCPMCVMAEHVKRVQNGGVVVPDFARKYLRQINNKLRPGRQEDAHEFLRFLLEQLSKHSNPELQMMGKTPIGQKPKIPVIVQSTTAIEQFFGGMMRSQVLCKTCNKPSNTFDPFLDFSIEIGRANNLEQAFQEFTKKEMLQGDNKYHCENCKKKSNATKQFLIQRPPNLLTVQLKRFSSFGRNNQKIGKHVKLPPTLNLAPFTTCPKDKCTYRLYAIVVHEGSSTRSGHYYAFVKASNNTWALCDDSHVRVVSEQTVLNQRAYLAFYERVEKPVPTKQKEEAVANAVTESNKRKLEEPSAASTPPIKKQSVAAAPATSSTEATDLETPVRPDKPVANLHIEMDEEVKPKSDKKKEDTPCNTPPKTGETLIKKSPALEPKKIEKPVSPLISSAAQPSTPKLPPKSPLVKPAEPPKVVEVIQRFPRRPLCSSKTMRSLSFMRYGRFATFGARRLKVRKSVPKQVEQKDEKPLTPKKEKVSSPAPTPQKPNQPIVKDPRKIIEKKKAGFAPQERISQAQSGKTQFGTNQVDSWEEDVNIDLKAAYQNALTAAQRSLQPAPEKRSKHDREYDAGKIKHKPKKAQIGVVPNKTAFDDLVRNGGGKKKWQWQKKHQKSNWKKSHFE